MTNYTCPKCNLKFEGRQELCPHCDSVMHYADTVYTCGSCKKPFKGKKEDCPHCGKKVKYRTAEDIKRERQQQAEAKKLKSKKQTKLILKGIGVLVIIIVIWVAYAKITAPSDYDNARFLLGRNKVQAKLKLRLIPESSDDYDSAQYWIRYIDSVQVVQDSLNKIAEKEAAIQDSINALEQLEREIKAIDDFNNMKYRGSVKDVQMELVLFEAWKLIAKEGAKDSKSHRSKSLAKKLQAKVIALQKREFPLMRKAYAKEADKVFWENDIRVKTQGSRNETIVFTGGTFAANKNIKDVHSQLREAMSEMRFKRANYKWYEGDDEYTYYTLDTKKDGE